MSRDPLTVARSHLEAVQLGDVAAMAADYAEDATLVRGTERYDGRTAIAAYFATVPDRLAGARVVFDHHRVDGNVVTFSWHLEGASRTVSGTDVCVVDDGAIVSQVVHLDGADF